MDARILLEKAEEKSVKFKDFIAVYKNFFKDGHIDAFLDFWNYANKVASLDYREVFSISFLILFICTFISQVSFVYIHENEYGFKFTEFLISILPSIPISFLLATFLKKRK